MIYQSSYDVGGEPIISKKTGFNKDLASSDVAADTPVVDGTAAVGVSEHLARADHIHPTDTTRAAASDLANKVDKDGAKVLSTNDFTTEYMTKLIGIQSNAEVNVQSDWDETDTDSDAYIQNKPSVLETDGYESTDEGKIAKVVKVGEEYKLQVTTAGTSSVSWNDVTDKPDTFTPSAHASTHASDGTDAISISAAQITSGTIDVARLPAIAVPTLKVVANQAARYALTTADVQTGDSVFQEDTQVMYFVKDDSKLSSEEGYQQYAPAIVWGGITGSIENQNDLMTKFSEVEGDITTLETTVGGHTSSIATLTTDVSTLDTNKVDKVSGKGLSTNDFTDVYKSKIDNMEVSLDIPFGATMLKSNRDDYNIYTTITWTVNQTDTSKPAKWVSVLSGGTAPLYTVRTLTIYNKDEAQLGQYIYTRAYDSDGVLISETPGA